MDEPSPVDAEVLRRTRQLIVNCIAQRSQAWMEAAAEAWGLCRGTQPAPPATVVDQAVRAHLKVLDLLPPQPVTVVVGDRWLVVTEPQEVADSLAYAMRSTNAAKPAGSRLSIWLWSRPSSW